MASAVCSRRSSATSTRSSVGTNATWLTQNGKHAMGKGQVLYTGPSGIRDYKVNVVTDDRMVGIGTMSAEGSAEINYIWREAPGTAPPIRRSAFVGEVGWLIPQFKDWRSFTSGHQITQSEFSKAQDEKFTHRWQEPWYPSPTHPDYNKQYKFRNTPYNNDTSPMYARSKTPNPYATPPPQTATSPYQRPHTVAAFRQDENPNLPSIDGHSNSNSRPGSGGQYSSASGHSVSRAHVGGRHTPVGSRPSSGTQSHQSSVGHSGIQDSRDGHSRPSSGASSYIRDSHASHTGSYRSNTGSYRSHIGSHKGSIGRRGGSRHSSARSGSVKRMSATPQATTVSNQYGGGHR
ncbi:uncharacterized protein [Amphiura filiformis]|uniref:uncharacterized protein n=1 Tax=Amphiura filiformis TaxID=82378 RepID=UPI003B21BF01